MQPNFLIYYILLTRTKFTVWYNYFARFIVNTRQITVIDDKTGKPYSVFWRYVFVRSFDYLVRGMIRVRNSFDIDVKKIQITKNYEEGEKTMILDAEQIEKEYVTIADIINHIDHTEDASDNTLSKTVLLKFELVVPEKEPVCLKDYILKYKDHNKKHHHTIGNILKFNDISVPLDTATIKITKMEKGKRHMSEVHLKAVHDDHISSLCT